MRQCAVVLLALATACCHPQPPSPPHPAACISNADLEAATAHMESSMTPEIQAKLNGFDIIQIYEALLRAKGVRDHAWVMPPLDGCIPDELSVNIYFRGDPAAVQKLAVPDRFLLTKTPKEGLLFARAQMKSSRLPDLLALPEVITVEAPLKERGELILNYSAPEIGTKVLRSQFPWMTGSGVTVLVIDSGIEWRHGAFMDPQGNSRIKWLWDLQLDENHLEPGENKGPHGGVLYSNQQITDAVNGRFNVRSKDHALGDGGHGTSTAGIAAGNGHPRTRVCWVCCGHDRYVGVAPEADIAIVRVPGAGAIGTVLDALSTRADLLDKPVVVNISLALNEGPRDGTHDIELSLDNFVASAPGRIVVVGAGNSANRKQHVSATVPIGQSVDIPIHTTAGFKDSRPLEVYFPAATPLAFQLVGPQSGQTAVIDHVQPPQILHVDNTIVSASFLTLPHNTDMRLALLFIGAGEHLAADGYWILRLVNQGASPVTAHAWWNANETQTELRFTTDGDPQAPPGIRASTDSTLTTPATARGAIAVAAYDQKSAVLATYTNDIKDYSGRGPARGDTPANPNPKPDIAAPGTDVRSPRNDVCNMRGNCCYCGGHCPDWLFTQYEESSGTSIAAPHVTGAVAVMLQVNPEMRADDARRFIRQNPRPAKPPGDPNAWGAGKIDMNQAVAFALQDHLNHHPQPHVVMARLASTAPPPPASSTPAEQPGSLGVVRALRGTPNGELVAGLVSRYFSEARRLVNSQPRVGAMWQRALGPAIVQKLAGGTGGAPLATDEQRDYFQKFLEQLKRYGSPSLQDSIDRYGSMIAQTLANPISAPA